jgi:23S rRNA (guanosine2251-2'-O)-methyltransferase
MQTKEQKLENESIIFGIRPIIEAIEAGKTIDRLMIQNGLRNELFGQLMGLLKKSNVAYKYVPAEKLNRITNKNHQGVIGYLSTVTYAIFNDVLESIENNNSNGFVLILDRITDVRNFGAIARTAESAGVHAIVVSEQGSAPINGDALKTSAGALSKIPVCREQNLSGIVNELKNSGFQIVACSEKANEFYFQHDFTLPTVIIVGSEENGISKNLVQLCDAHVKIPMLGKVGSLNVSVATGIVLYEVVSQRMIH